MKRSNAFGTVKYILAIINISIASFFFKTTQVLAGWTQPTVIYATPEYFACGDDPICLFFHRLKHSPTLLAKDLIVLLFILLLAIIAIIKIFKIRIFRKKEKTEITSKKNDNQPQK